MFIDNNESSVRPGHDGGAEPTIATIVDGLFFQPDNTTLNLRTMLHNGVRSEFFCDKTSLAAAVIKTDRSSVKARFVQVHEIDADTASSIPANAGVKGCNICKYRWLVFDIDTIRPNKSKSNASDEEKNKIMAGSAGSLRLPTSPRLARRRDLRFR